MMVTDRTRSEIVRTIVNDVDKTANELPQSYALRMRTAIAIEQVARMYGACPQKVGVLYREGIDARRASTLDEPLSPMRRALAGMS